MRKLIWIIKLIVLAIVCYGIFYLVKYDAGYTLISYKNFYFESSLLVFLLIILSFWFAFYLLSACIKFLFSFFNLFNPWSLRNKTKRSEKAAEKGLLAAVEGDYKVAVKQLTKAAQGYENPLFLLLDASVAANKAGDFKQSDDLLERALKTNPKDKRAINLTSADLKIKRGEYDNALEILEQLKQEKVNDAYVVRLILEAYIGQKNIKGILSILKEAYKYSVFSEDQLKNIEINAWKDYFIFILNLNGATDVVEQLEMVWDEVPRAMKIEKTVLLTYANCLIQSGYQNKSEEILRKILPSNYFSEAMKLYGLIESDNLEVQLQFATKMANLKEDSASLLSLGRIAKRSGDISLAKESLKKVINLNNDPYALIELSQILNVEGEYIKATELLNNSINILSGSNLNKQSLNIGYKE